MELRRCAEHCRCLAAAFTVGINIGGVGGNKIMSTCWLRFATFTGKAGEPMAAHG
jgi:hypothetical protein